MHLARARCVPPGEVGLPPGACCGRTGCWFVVPQADCARRLGQMLAADRVPGGIDALRVLLKGTAQFGPARQWPDHGVDCHYPVRVFAPGAPLGRVVSEGAEGCPAACPGYSRAGQPLGGGGLSWVGWGSVGPLAARGGICCQFAEDSPLAGDVSAVHDLAEDHLGVK